MTISISYCREPFTVLQNLNLLLKKIDDPRCKDRDGLNRYFGEMLRFAAKAVADSRGDSRIWCSVTVGLLRLSEGYIRAQDSPSDLVGGVRNIRGGLIRALQLECESLIGVGHVSRWVGCE